MGSKKQGSPNLKLSPIQGELLVLLAEAGAENLRCIVAELKPRDLSAFEVEVRQLVSAGLVALYRDLGREGLRYVELSREEESELSPFCELLSGEIDRTRFEGLMLTEAGHAARRR